MIASERWAEIDAAYYQIRLIREKPHRFANMVYAWCIERVEHEKLGEWISELGELLPWQDADSEAAVDLETKAFMDAMAKQQR